MKTQTSVNSKKKNKKNGLKIDLQKNQQSQEMTNGTYVAHADHSNALKPALGLKANKLERVSQILNKTLSNQHVLYVKTRNYHWNLVGKRFHTLHVFLEKLYKDLEMAIDETAERTRILGGIPKASMKEFLATATLLEDEGRLIDGDEAIAHLLRDHQASVVALRQSIQELEDKIGDAGTADFLTDLLRVHEKTAWMLRSHLTA